MSTTSLSAFLMPVFKAYEGNGIHMSFSKIENGIVFINIDKRMCGG